MDKYNFNDADAPLCQTKRLGDLPEEVKKLEALRGAAPQALGDEKAFLNVVQSEALDDDGYMTDEDLAQLKLRNRRFLRIVVAIAVLIGLAVCMVGFKIMTTFLDKGVETPVEAAPIVSEDHTMLVRSITDKEELVIFDLDSNENYTVKTSMDTKMSGINGLELQLRDISPGDILRIRVITANQMATEISYPSDAWIKEGITGVEIDTLAKSIALTKEGVSGVGAFTYSDDALFLYQEKDVRPADLTTSDTITLRGIDNRVWSVSVNGFHGYVTVINGNAIVNGSIQVDKNEPLPLHLAARMPIGEGVHTLIIKGDNIEDRTEPVFIIANEETTVNLTAAQSKTGVLIVKANAADYKLYVNGAEAKADMPVVLPQGDKYDIAIFKHGYQPWSTTVQLDQPSVTVTAVLIPETPKGILTITTVPSGATVTLDGSYLGMSPISRQVETGNHEISIQLNGYTTYHGTVSLEGASGLVNIPLTPQIPAEEAQQRRLNNEGREQGDSTSREPESQTPSTDN